MPEDEREIIDQISKALPELTKGQLVWVQKVIKSFKSDIDFKIQRSDFINEEILRDFGYALLIHHTFSKEPFSKDKFEYVLVTILNLHNINSELAPKGNPGHDITIGNYKVSLKTQADKAIKIDTLWISKFMELGKGTWGENYMDLEQLVQQFLRHLENYDKIFTLRNLSKNPDWQYELVEIPKSLLVQAKSGELEMKMDSLQTPKPGYCYVRDKDNNPMFQLYFDGGSERKLQIKNLKKEFCLVHGEWEFPAM